MSQLIINHSRATLSQNGLGMVIVLFSDLDLIPVFGSIFWFVQFLILGGVVPIESEDEVFRSKKFFPESS